MTHHLIVGACPKDSISTQLPADAGGRVGRVLITDLRGRFDSTITELA